MGPASSSKETIGKLVEAGADIFRINLSHCSHIDAKQIVEDLQNYLEESKVAAEVGIWIDMNGPKVRTGKLPNNEPVYVESGADFFFVNDISLIGDNTRIATTYSKELLDIGDKIFVDDVNVSFTVVERLENSVKTIADNSGYVGTNKGINFPSHVIDELPAFSEIDKRDLDFALELGVDFVSLSCIRSIDDIDEARLLLGNSKSKLLAKIENEKSMENFESILKRADGIVIDRGYRSRG
ncbi:hypothetical protein HK096_007934 [Nowakowskiella sp. JEL0078]|nr:hypothetical protein HK096_007934 [Nowakowskiella sp. JEL0078]